MVAHYLLLRETACFIAPHILQISRMFSLRMFIKDSSSRASVTNEWRYSPNFPVSYVVMLCARTNSSYTVGSTIHFY